jgi:hypothetical protein
LTSLIHQLESFQKNSQCRLLTTFDLKPTAASDGLSEAISGGCASFSEYRPTRITESGFGSVRVTVWKLREGREERWSCDAGTKRIDGSEDVSFLVTPGREDGGNDTGPASVPWSVLERVISTATGAADEVAAVVDAILEVVCDLRRLVGGGCTAGGICTALSGPVLLVGGCAEDGVVGDKVLSAESGPGEGDAVSLVNLFLEATSGVLPAL